MLAKLLASPAYETVKVLVREPLKTADLKLQTILFDFDNPDASTVVADDVFCCLGTTIKRAGSKVAFRKVDYDYPILIAQLAKLNGAQRFSIVTAMGADAHSSIFYNQVKGEVEQRLAEIDFESLLVFRPSLLLGNRPERRLGEQIGGVFFRLFAPIIPQKYRAIEAEKVAEAMLQKTVGATAGVHVFESDALQAF